jgi:glycosyltransferase involved in cell wall biosynthesis
MQNKLATPAPLVCVIVLNYNGIDHLNYCLPSLLATDYANYQVLLVDNASSDASLRMVADKHPRVSIIASRKNLGWSGGNNLGIAKAIESGAKYVILANNDIKVDSRWLREAVATAEMDPRIGIIGFNVFEADGRVDNVADFLMARQVWSEVQFLPTGNVGGMAMFVRAAVFGEIGVIDEGYFVYGEENDFQIRAEKAGYRTVSINVPVWHFGQGFFGTVPARAAMLQTRSKIRLLIKHGSVFAAIRGGFRHVFRRLLHSAPLADTVVERRLKPSNNLLINLALFLYCVSWNLWFLPNTLLRRRQDNRRAQLARQRWDANGSNSR